QRRRRGAAPQAEGQAQRFGCTETPHTRGASSPPGCAAGSGKRVPKKIAGLEEPATRLKVEAIVIIKSAHRLEDLLVAAGLARSTFFYHQKRLAAPDKHAGLKQAIRDSFQRNKHRYGYRRVLLDLRNQGRGVNHKRGYKLMQPRALKSKGRGKKYNPYKGAASHNGTHRRD